MRALVTGASGLIGAHIVQALVDAGHNVRGLVRNKRSDDALPAAYVVADLLDPAADLKAACIDCDTVFHAAAYFAYSGFSTSELRNTAVAGSERILHACAEAGVSRVVITSSSVVFGYTERPTAIGESAGLASASAGAPYVRAKIAQHQRTLELGAQLNLDVRLACPTMTLGPTSSRLGPSNGLIAAYLSDPFACTFPGGCNIVSARDVARGHMLIAEHGKAAESYLLGSQNMTWRQIHTTIAELAGVAPPRVTLNNSLAYLAATIDEVRAAIDHRTALSTREQAEMIDRYYWYSHAKAASLGYSPASARDALIEAISWLAATPHISRETRIGMHLSPEIYRFRAAQAA
jgi:dihydroflavonol-4-reductase